MNYGSVCSGIEAATVAWHSLGWKPEWFSEIEKFPSRVLAHHYPDVPNLGDMTKIAALIQREVVDAPDVLVGGTPCQAFSVAGLRNSLNDDRGQENAVFKTAATLTRGFGDRGVDADQIANGNCAIEIQGVRRFTPVECERLQGFPDNYTNVANATDTPRYAALGNSMAVPVMKWIGERIQEVCGGAA